MPAELLARLGQAIDRLDTKMIQQVVDNIREYNDALADELDALTYQFDYDTIAEWIKNIQQAVHE